MPRPDMPSLLGRSPSSLSLSPSFLPLLSLTLSHSCHAARTSNNSTTARRGKATSRRSSPTYSFSRILLPSSSKRFFLLLLLLLLRMSSLSLSCTSSCVNFTELDACPLFYPPLFFRLLLPAYETLPRSLPLLAAPRRRRQVRHDWLRRPVLWRLTDWLTDWTHSLDCQREFHCSLVLL